MCPPIVPSLTGTKGTLTAPTRWTLLLLLLLVLQVECCARTCTDWPGVLANRCAHDRKGLMALATHVAKQMCRSSSGQSSEASRSATWRTCLRVSKSLTSVTTRAPALCYEWSTAAPHPQGPFPTRTPCRRGRLYDARATRVKSIAHCACGRGCPFPRCHFRPSHRPALRGRFCDCTQHTNVRPIEPTREGPPTTSPPPVPGMGPPLWADVFTLKVVTTVVHKP